MSRQEKEQETSENDGGKREKARNKGKKKKNRKKPLRSSAAFKEAECMMQGLMGVVRGYRVCLFRPERTTVLR